MTITAKPRATARVNNDDRAQMIADKIETRARIDQLNRSLTKLYRRLDYLTKMVPDE